MLTSHVVDGKLTTNLELREEQIRLADWWSRTCNAVNYNRRDIVLRDVRTNEILKLASAFFAQAELDHRIKS
ncbi:MULTISPECIES: hypothetical protein [Burkholderia]|uniref:hypothetical protein n=1 Tax=Burkholderia TaxID=32008 RepID=UPI00163F018B|nr:MULTISPECIES: hypothetical protein [Burkholderia]MBU9170867.1 hypothetical protein [Burkholderia gladioli]